MSRHVWTLICCLFLAACDEGFEPASRIDGLRLLAIQADHPSASAGQQVTLSALYRDTKGRSLSWGYAFCDSQNSSAALDCLKSMDMDSLRVTQDEPEHSFVMPVLANSGERDSSVGIAVIVCPGQIVPGNTDGIAIACEADGRALPLDDFEIGVKRVYYGTDGENQNPMISALHWDGEPWPEGEARQVAPCARNTDDVEKCSAAARHTIEVEADGATEAFVDTRGARATEQAVVQFYGTGGSFEWSARVPGDAETRWVARREDAGKTLTLYFVVRDSRGGVSWQTREVEVSEP